MNLEESLTQYTELRSKVDAKFAEIAGRNSKDFACGVGCHSCCLPGLTVNPLEAEAIRRYLDAHPEKRSAPSFGKNRCRFLGANGACSIYEARPLVCRSHGAPLQYRDPENKKFEEALRFRDVCPLNFQEKDLGKLPAEDVFNLDTVNTLLSLLASRAFGKKAAIERVPLESI